VGFRLAGRGGDGGQCYGVGRMWGRTLAPVHGSSLEWYTRVYTTRDYGITYLFHDRCTRANMSQEKRDKLFTFQWSGLWDVISLQTLCWEIEDKSRSWNNRYSVMAVCDISNTLTSYHLFIFKSHIKKFHRSQCTLCYNILLSIQYQKYVII